MLTCCSHSKFRNYENFLLTVLLLSQILFSLHIWHAMSTNDCWINIAQAAEDEYESKVYTLDNHRMRVKFCVLHIIDYLFSSFALFVGRYEKCWTMRAQFEGKQHERKWEKMEKNCRIQFKHEKRIKKHFMWQWSRNKMSTVVVDTRRRWRRQEWRRSKSSSLQLLIEECDGESLSENWIFRMFAQ